MFTLTWGSALLYILGPTCQFTSSNSQFTQFKSDRLKCLWTQKLTELIQSWSNQKCWISSNLPVFNYGIELIWIVGTFMLNKLKFCSFFNNGIKLIWKTEIFSAGKFKFVPFHPQIWTYPFIHTHTCMHACTHTHTHAHTHTHTHTRTSGVKANAWSYLTRIWTYPVSAQQRKRSLWPRHAECIWTYSTWTYQAWPVHF